jgi:hypothetical protein
MEYTRLNLHYFYFYMASVLEFHYSENGRSSKKHDSFKRKLLANWTIRWNKIYVQGATEKF